ncbi:hypothetical protein [Lysobacter sp. CFH 32150]|uniref:hypothetical protein n=1 Tax=Lysobacter sp. CFH 32150 TaxID=2927128 RepID=UPI001FA70291|nr:hypothetical protein [Lysobacter sp. CFH 32150]MCI4566384.1 hypothetical protein [Lysobacter sp. CFH 32150]
MSAQTLQAQLPVLPDKAIFSDPAHTIRSADGLALLTYDPSTRAAFIYIIASKRWTILAPIDFAAFAILVAASGHAIPDSEDARRWVATCMPRGTGAKVH